ncbi:hypothetical protein ABT061_39000 [Streptosporangium sp. NPDC002544]|uniref:hypothetical protein n=1 Tax=Streptosporangium sp. NPDC002544 TaxID=3154538 RepID=UPI00332CC873
MLLWERWRKRRWIRCAVIVFVPFLLLYVLAMAPAWIHNHQLDGLADRFLSHPLPPETDFYDDEIQGSIAIRPGSNSNHCDYRLRFNLETELSVDEVVRYYRSAKIPGIDGNEVDVIAWTSPDMQPHPDNFNQLSIILEVQDYGHGADWDTRCW